MHTNVEGHSLSTDTAEQRVTGGTWMMKERRMRRRGGEETKGNTENRETKARQVYLGSAFQHSSYVYEAENVST